jgi:hypothetical protein
LVALSTGAFVLARSRGLRIELSVFVSLIAALNGWIICWGASDWFGALGAFSWMPWAWCALEKAAPAAPSVTVVPGPRDKHDPRHREATSSLPGLVWPAPFVYLLVTGGFPYTVLMLGLLITWLTIRKWVQTRRILAPAPMWIGAALGFGMGAPALWALLTYVHGSARELQPASSHWQWIVPPAALPGLILPNWTSNWADFSSRYMPHGATELACGLVAPVALLTALITDFRAVARRIHWDLILLGAVLIFSMIPTTGVFRWSFRWLPFFHLTLGLCAAESLQLWEKSSSSRSGGRRSPGMVALILAGAVGLLIIMFKTGGKYSWPLTAILLVLAALWAALDRMKVGRSPASGRSPEARRWLDVHHWLPAAITFASLLATYVCIPPNCGVPRYNFTETLMDPAPLDQNRLYLSVYPPAESDYRSDIRPDPVGQVVRPGSTSMWGKLHFVNGYSPIRPAGVARALFFSIHGEVDSGTAFWLLYGEAGPEGLLAQIGVDGLTIAREEWLNPEPRSEWQLVTATNEGRVFHRRGRPLPRVRSVLSTPGRPEMEYAAARIANIQESRECVSADVDVPAGERPALISISRPYFDGYRATLGGNPVSVSSDRSLFPVVELAPGSRGRLVVRYRPPWLVYGAALGAAAAVVWLCSLAAAWRLAKRQ